jgi:lipid-A-disaccharide synthase-like uncharacterized protein
MAVNVWDIDGCIGGVCFEDRYVIWWIPARASALLVPRDWLVRCAVGVGKADQ